MMMMMMMMMMMLLEKSIPNIPLPHWLAVFFSQLDVV